MDVDAATKSAMVDPIQIEGFLDEMPNNQAAGHFYSCTHSTFSPNLLDGGSMKTNVIPDTVDINVDIRTVPGESTAEVEAHLAVALGDLADQVQVEIIMDDPATISRIDTPLWDSLQRAVSKPFPGAELSPQLIVGFTDSRIYREMGAIAYGAGLFSPDLDAASYGSRFHGNDERIDTESLRLSTDLFVEVAKDLLGP